MLKVPEPESIDGAVKTSWLFFNGFETDSTSTDSWTETVQTSAPSNPAADQTNWELYNADIQPIGPSGRGGLQYKVAGLRRPYLYIGGQGVTHIGDRCCKGITIPFNGLE